MSNKLIVMYLGNVVEEGDATEIFENPVHPYTRALMSAVPSWDPNQRKLSKLRLFGEPPSPVNPPIGCVFSTRCLYKFEHCEKERPQLNGNENHRVACFLHKG